jgi:hypothetical protein
MHANAYVLDQDIVMSARTARPKMMSNVILKDHVLAVVDDPQSYIELIVIFYSPEAKNKRSRKLLQNAI